MNTKHGSRGNLCFQGENTAELKHLFLRKDFRGRGLARLLVERVIRDAREIGYSSIVLDTLYPRMEKAVGLYRAHGFENIPPSYHNPHAGVLFMQLSLR